MSRQKDGTFLLSERIYIREKHLCRPPSPKKDAEAAKKEE